MHVLCRDDYTLKVRYSPQNLYSPPLLPLYTLLVTTDPPSVPLKTT